MATIEITHSHAMGTRQLRDVVEEVAQKLQENLDMEYQWSESGEEVTFARRGADGRVLLGDEEVRIELNLGTMLRSLKGPIEKRIRAHLDEALS